MKALKWSPVLFFLLLSGCSGGGGSSSQTQSLALSLSSSSVQVLQDGTASTLTITATCNNVTSPQISFTGLPAGVSSSASTVTCNSPTTVSLSVTNASVAAANTYSVTVQGAASGQTSTATLSVQVIAEASVTNLTTGGQAAFMSTAVGLADWYNDSTGNPFVYDLSAHEANLNGLQSKHISAQLLSSGYIPQTGATAWDFTNSDIMLQPLLTVADKSPQYVIGTQPLFLANSDGSYNPANLSQYAQFAANLVSYYNTGGFTVNGTTYKSPSSTPVTWWGIHNEPNWEGVSPGQYVTLYNTLVQAMRAVDPTTKFVALELGDQTGAPQDYLPPLLAGATQPIDAVATHFYPACGDTTTDSAIFSTTMDATNGAEAQIAYFRSTMNANPAYANTPIWVTESNIDGDYEIANGMSNCNNTVKYVLDPRGTSTFYAAWGPLLYSQLTKGGASGVWHYSYLDGQQYAEAANDGSKYISYWVDYYLSNYFGQEPMNIITTSVTEPQRLEIFAASKADGTRVIMLVNHDVANTSTDNNGAGVPKTVVLDLSGAGSFTTAQLLTIDASTNLSTGPQPVTVTPANNKLTITSSGYGVQFLTLQ